MPTPRRREGHAFHFLSFFQVINLGALRKKSDMKKKKKANDKPLEDLAVNG